MFNLRNRVIDAAVFGCGAVVMTYEIVGSRVIAPYLGNSTYTWTSLIGVILGALSLGYWLGGKWADRLPKLSVLAAVIFAAGGMVSITVLIKDVFLSILASAALPIELSTVICAIVLFAPASILLGFVTPYAVRLSVTSVERSGSTVGNLYALSTIGSIAGTFLAGFFLIPFVGTNRTLYLLAAILFVISASIVPIAASKVTVGLLVAFISGIVVTEINTLVSRASNNLVDIDTEYSRVRIFDTTKNGRPLRAMSIDPYIYQSSIYLDTGEAGAEYLSYYHLVSHFYPGFRRALIVGGAGYGFPRQFLDRYPDSTIDVVEIDPAMTRLAKSYFRLQDNERLSSIHSDGRLYLNRAGSKTYDAVFIDAFNSLFSIPFQLTTVEAAREIKRVLGEKGVVFVNMGTAIEGPGSRFLFAESKTYQNVFPHVRLYRVNKNKSPEGIQNVILVASESPLQIESTDESVSNLLRNELSLKMNDAMELTDDLAPVERMLSFAQNAYVTGR